MKVELCRHKVFGTLTFKPCDVRDVIVTCSNNRMRLLLSKMKPSTSLPRDRPILPETMVSTSLPNFIALQV